MAGGADAPRLLIDCGHTVYGRHYTGIQRYVRRTTREAVAWLGSDAVGGIAADRTSGWSAVAELPVHGMEGLPAIRLARQERIRFTRDSHVLLADRFWHTEAWEALDTLLDSQAFITAVVYDLLSLRQPQWFPPGVGERFERYLRRVLPRANRVVCLTRHVAKDVAEWAAEKQMWMSCIDVVAPGHQVWTGAPRPPAGLPPAWREGAQRFVLQVGTLEPRKNHRLTLEAMRRLWSAGDGPALLLIGQQGWLTEDLARELRAGEAAGRLCWLTQCTDAELDWCYRHAAAVVYPSAAEGYGLPLAEALAAGARAVASNTPAHREVVQLFGEAGCRAQLCDTHPEALADCLAAALTAPLVGPPSGTRDWGTATRTLLSTGGGAIPGHP